MSVVNIGFTELGEEIKDDDTRLEEMTNAVQYSNAAIITNTIDASFKTIMLGIEDRLFNKAFSVCEIFKA